MLMKIAHHNEGKKKWESHTCYLFNDANDYHDFDITNIRGYGETKEEAVDNLKKNLSIISMNFTHWKRCFTKQMYLIMILLKLTV